MESIDSSELVFQHQLHQPPRSHHPSPLPATNHPKLAQCFPRKLPGTPEVEWEGRRRFIKRSIYDLWVDSETPSTLTCVQATTTMYGKMNKLIMFPSVSFAHLDLNLKTNEINELLKGMAFALESKKGYQSIWMVHCSSFHNFRPKKRTIHFSVVALQNAGGFEQPLLGNPPKVRLHMFQKALDLPWRQQRKVLKVFWLVVERTPLKNIRQNGNLPQIGVKKEQSPSFHNVTWSHLIQQKVANQITGLQIAFPISSIAELTKNML